MYVRVGGFIQTLLINIMQITTKLEATWEDLQFEFMDVAPSLIDLFSAEWMISIKLFKLVANVRNPPLCSDVTAVPSGPKSHTFTVILAVFAPPAKGGVISREKVYLAHPQSDRDRMQNLNSHYKFEISSFKKKKNYRKRSSYFMICFKFFS